MLIEFGIFVVLQSMMINGVYECFQGGCWEDIHKGRQCSGMVFYNISPKFFEKYKNRSWSKPLWSCVKCMASFWGSVSYWPTVITGYGFHGWEIPAWIADMLILVYLNYYIYKKI